MTCDISCSLTLRTQILAHYTTSQIHQLLISLLYIQGKGEGVGTGVIGGDDASYDLPLIIGHCQSLHNKENSAPSHVEHPRSLIIVAFNPWLHVSL